MLKRSLLTAAVLALAAIFTVGMSLADYRVCNRTGQEINVAFGYPHPQFGWTSEGWWVIRPGGCRTIMRGDLTNRYYYLYATGSEGSIWQGRDSQEGGFFCVDRNKFVFHNSNFIIDGALNCAARNLVARKFVLVNTRGAPDHVHNLDE